jgi:hypothetical protein
MKRKAILCGRLLFLGLISLCVLPACGGGTATGGPAAAAGILWNPTSTPGATGGSTAPAGVLWVDPNSGSPGGFTPYIPSNDMITYSSPTVYIAGNTHPLSTASSAQNITQAEGGLMQALNAYRSKQLNGNGGGIGGGGGLGGGGFVVPPQNAFLQASEGLTRNARANCKHFALYHAGAFGAANPEGDSVNAGGVAPAGRLAKTGITAGGVTEIRLAGPQYADYNTVANYMTSNYGAALTNLQVNKFGVGYWTGGTQKYYWCVILAVNPMP